MGSSSQKVGDASIHLARAEAERPHAVAAMSLLLDKHRVSCNQRGPLPVRTDRQTQTHSRPTNFAQTSCNQRGPLRTDRQTHTHIRPSSTQPHIHPYDHPSHTHPRAVAELLQLRQVFRPPLQAAACLPGTGRSRRGPVPARTPAPPPCPAISQPARRHGRVPCKYGTIVSKKRNVPNYKSLVIRPPDMASLRFLAQPPKGQPEVLNISSS